MKAIWNNKVIAESNKTVEIEGNQYFPPESVNKEYLDASEMKTTCPWKGSANYFDIIVDGDTNKNSVWTYKNPKERAEIIKGYFAFWKGVKITQ